MKANRVGKSHYNDWKFLLKKVIPTVCLCIGFIVLLLQSISAQPTDRMGEGPSPEQIVSALKQQLELTDEKAVLILPIMKEDMDRHRKFWKNTGSETRENQDYTRAKLKTIERETDEKLASVLSTEQLKKFQKLRDKYR